MIRLYALPVIATLLLASTSAFPNDSPPAPEEALLDQPLTLEQANRLAGLPLACLQQEYPNKLGQTIGSAEDLGEPSALHPAFYGCFDWHSAVHGHWSLVALLRRYPDLARGEEGRRILAQHLTAANVAREVEYFQGEHNKTYERTYGWAWLLKLDQELAAWDAPLAQELHGNLQPLSALIVERYLEFLPKLNYAIRTGEHPNTAFGLTFAFDYAQYHGHGELLDAVGVAARRFYADDAHCPLTWEPGGYDFLSPCLTEIDIMRRVLPPQAFHRWLQRFLPDLTKPGYTLAVGRVSDRSDGKLVHLDGLNFSRAWALIGLADRFPERYGHLLALAGEHMDHSLPNLVGDRYEGGHWLGSFALYALMR
ncbi:MAG: DUF2891 domain-containing protein [Pseudomonadota bacterium]